MLCYPFTAYINIEKYVRSHDPLELCRTEQQCIACSLVWLSFFLLLYLCYLVFFFFFAFSLVLLKLNLRIRVSSFFRRNDRFPELVANMLHILLFFSSVFAIRFDMIKIIYFLFVFHINAIACALCDENKNTKYPKNGAIQYTRIGNRTPLFELNFNCFI